MPTVRSWLVDLGLEHYATSFERNDVDMQVLPALSEADLERLGVSLGHRKRIWLALHPEQAPAAGALHDINRPTAPPAASALASANAAVPELDGERRQVTVLFCDLVGSTALSNRLDPEDYRALLARYHAACITAVQRFDGFVAQVQGDGILAYFGYPLAHEAEGERALQAGLAIVDAVSALHFDDHTSLAVRVGVATGLVVVSHILAADKSAVGETPNLAQRLQTLAGPGEVITMDATRNLAPGAFDYEDRGAHRLKGFALPLPAWRVRGASGMSRFEAATRSGITDLVGREQEVGLLLDRWALSAAGEGQIVLLQGEPGIGKSRLLQAFRDRVDAVSVTTLQYQCSAYFTNSAFYPIAEHLRRAMGFLREDTIETRLDKIERYLSSRPGEHGDADGVRRHADLLARMLAIPCEARYGPLTDSPQRQKDDTINLLVDLVAELAGRQPTMVLFEDIHWADPTTLEVLTALVDRTERLALLVLMTYRPELVPPWTSRAHVTALTLSRLSRTQSASIVMRVAGKPLPADLVLQIVDKADGVPLFIEELTKAVLESPLLLDHGDRYAYSGKNDRLAIPDTLRDSLTARLDRLIPVKEIAQIGACFGREFSYEMLQAVSPMTQAQLDQALDKLTASELVFRRGTPPEARYVFKHALVQDAAYDSLLKSKRQALHADIAQAIEQRFPSRRDTEPELLAHHYTEAGLIDMAVPLWRKAGDLARQRVALQESIQYYERGLDLLAQLPGGRSRDAQELQLRTVLGMAWMSLHGYNHPQVAANLELALALGGPLDDSHYTLQILWGLWVYTLCSGRIGDSLERAHRLLDTAQRTGSIDMLLAGHWAACNSRYFMGDFRLSVEHADQILARYDAQRDRHIADLIIHDPMTIALAYKSAAQWRLGFPSQARATAQAAIAQSERRRHYFDYCWVRAFLAHTLFADSGDTDAIATALNEGEPVAADQKLIFFTEIYYPMARAFWLLRRGEGAAADALFREATLRWTAAGVGVYLPGIRILHAASPLDLKRYDEALALIDQALEQINRPGWKEGEHFSEALRLQALVLRARGDHQQVLALLEQALAVARRQEARSWELRAACDYAEQLAHAGRIDHAIAVLDEVVGWFRDGHDTPDVRRAGALLERLRAPAQQIQPLASADS